MRSTPLSIVALIGLGVSLSFAAIAVPASAAPVNGAISKNLASPMNLEGSNSLIEEVQYRRGRRGHRGYGHRGRGRGHRGGNGAGVAAGVLGGLFLGSVIANQGQQRDVEYCSQRYRSYDPRSGTYLGYDGRRHACP